MSTSLHKEELIEKFVQGELSGEELQAFENEMAGDAVLREEVQMQQDIVKVISENRRAQFKNRLNSIEVGGASYTGYYAAAGIASVAIIGLISIFSGVFDGDNTVLEPTVETAEQEIVESFDQEPIEMESNSQTEIVEDSETEEIVSATQSEPTGEIIVETSIENNAVNEENSTEQTQIEKPVLPQNDEEVDFVNTEFENPSGNDLSGAKIELSKVEVEIDTDSDYDFHYKYFNNKLFLYGDFSSSPYELIELNTKKSRDLYMFFKGKYYALESNQLEVTKLAPLRDKIIIRGLDNLR